jgi:nitrogen fixation-related uncharacterized protein
MIIFYLSIPLMLFAVAIAVAPLFWAMKRQFESEAQGSIAAGAEESAFERMGVLPRVSGRVDPCSDVTDLAA